MINKIAILLLPILIFLSVLFVIYKKNHEVGINKIDTPLSKSELVKELNQKIINSNSKTLPSNKTAENSLINSLKERKDLIKELIKTDPDQARNLILPSKITSTLNTNHTNLIETPVDISGETEVIIEDDFINQKSKTDYVMHTQSGEKFELLLKKTKQQSQLEIEPNLKINVSGTKLDNYIFVDKHIVNSHENSKDESVLGFTTIKKVAFVLFNFSTKPVTPFTVEDVKKSAFTNYNSVKAFYEEVSHGRTTIVGINQQDGDVFGWFTLPISNDTCDYNLWMSTVASQAASKGVDLTLYDNVVYVPIGGSVPGFNCNWAGKASLEGKWSIVNADDNLYRVKELPGEYLESNFIKTSAHELGHNFGEMHSNLYVCKDLAGQLTSISSDCVVKEYGDSFDTMGSSNFYSSTNHFNTLHKARLGYINTGLPNTVEAPSSTGNYTYDIFPMETSSDKIQIVRIPRDINNLGTVDSYYYLSYRQPIGYYDSHSYNGISLVAFPPNFTFKSIQLHYGPPFLQSRATNLISSHPNITIKDGSIPDFFKAPLNIGEVFYDSIKNITITLLFADNKKATVKIVRGTAPCTPILPVIKIENPIQYGKHGEHLVYNYSIENKSSGCNSSVFMISGLTNSSNLEIVSADKEITVPLGGVVSGSIIVTSSTNTIVPVGSNTFRITAASQDFPGQYSSTIGEYIIYSSTVDDILPATYISKPLNNAVIKTDTEISIYSEDFEGINRVDLYLNNIILNTFWYTTSKPRGLFLSKYPLYKTALSSGKNELKSKAYDINGNTQESEIITVYNNALPSKFDINSDGKENLADIPSELDFLKYNPSPNSTQYRYDTNDDGMFDINDALMLLNQLFINN